MCSNEISPFVSTAPSREEHALQSLLRLTDALDAGWPPTSTTFTRTDPNGADVTFLSTISPSNVTEPVTDPLKPLTGSVASTVNVPAGTPSNRKLPSLSAVACSSV